jgi:replicative DNA helicase
MRMIAIDRQTVMQIFGSLMNKPSLLSEVDKYQLDPQDFTSQLDKFIFSAIYNLYAGGAQNIHTLDIDNYLQTNELAKNLMERDNGIAFL